MGKTTSGKPVANEPNSNFSTPPTIRPQGNFVLSFLAGKEKLSRPFRTNADVSRFLLETSLAELGGVAIVEPSPFSDARIAMKMADEIAAAIGRDGHSDAQHWYSKSLRRAVAVASVLQPEIESDDRAVACRKAGFRSAADARTVLFAAMAITSQNIPVRENTRYAIEQYRHFVASGRFAPKGYGTKGASVKANLSRFNQMVDIFEGNLGKLADFLGTEFSMGELAAAMTNVGISIGSREMIDEPVYGSMMFGPKIGAFYANLSGRFSVLTADLWFTRTFGRYTGTLIKDVVSPAQVERFVKTLKRDRSLTAQLKRDGDWTDPKSFSEMSNDELLGQARLAFRIWERRRKKFVARGATNEAISERKAKLGWPGAAESIIKAVGAPIDAPTTKSQRRWMRSVVMLALDILRDRGYDLNVAEAQALLWTPERELWLGLRGKKPDGRNASYDEAMTAFALKEGIDERTVRAAIFSVDGERFGRRRRGAGARQGDAAPGGGDRQAVVAGRRAAQAGERDGEDLTQALPVRAAM